MILCHKATNMRPHSSLLDKLFHTSYIAYMEWSVEYTDEFEAWWNALTPEEQDVIDAKVELLQNHGPALTRPHSDGIVTSKHSNMKELRGKSGEVLLRVLYAFDPKRTAILLIGGDKAANPKWYQEFVPVADRLFDLHLKAVAKERNK